MQSLKTGKIWFNEAVCCPSPNYDERPDSLDVSLLVIHNISLPPARFGGGYIEAFFQNKLDLKLDSFFETVAELKVSAHFLIARDGVLTQFVSLDKRAWHAGISCFDGRECCNDFSIGIELEGTDTLPYTPEQYRVLVDVTRKIQAVYPAISVERITGHSDIAPTRKTDPGKAFDWSLYRDLLNRK